MKSPEFSPDDQFLPALALVPPPSAKRIAVHITSTAERALRRGHPWLFDQSITRMSRAGSPGDLAVIFDSDRQFLAVGLYDPYSPIRVRVLQHGKRAPIDAGWFRDKLAVAARLREPLLEQPPGARTTGYRFVHGENDGLPGLVIDRYEDTLVIKLYTLAWLPHLKAVLREVMTILSAQCLVLRFSRSLAGQTQNLHGLKDGMVIYGPELTTPVIFRENGLFFEAEVLAGQKTGFFCDQRDNRRRVETLAGGRHVLNVFAYTGGFSVYAARGGAREITSIDTSLPALEAAQRNMVYNRHIPAVTASRHEIFVEDAFAALARLASEGRRYELVIIDPPAFAQNRNQVPLALQAYTRLTRLGLGVLQSGGTLVQASCSSRVTAETFFESILHAANSAGRPLIEIERTGHPLDHPVRFPEGEYLKCLYAVAA